MNLNKGCIEMLRKEQADKEIEQMNLNKGCIEIELYHNHLA